VVYDDRLMVVEREDHRVILNEICGNSGRRSTVVRNRIDALEDFRKQLEGADVDLLRGMVRVFAEQLIGADADALCGADYGERSPERVNRRNGYRERAWDTRAGTISLAVPKLREGTRVSQMATELDREVKAFRNAGEGAPGHVNSVRTVWKCLYLNIALSPPEGIAEPTWTLQITDHLWLFSGGAGSADRRGARTRAMRVWQL
jgi:hypothetical protein